MELDPGIAHLLETMLWHTASIRFSQVDPEDSQAAANGATGVILCLEHEINQRTKSGRNSELTFARKLQAEAGTDTKIESASSATEAVKDAGPGASSHSPCIPPEFLQLPFTWKPRGSLSKFTPTIEPSEFGSIPATSLRDEGVGSRLHRSREIKAKESKVPAHIENE
ncbi:hypothetical protein K504DRAFT_505758 [Pleomassaria siparia CBS 279.74]|uniref:Uncharacterized protein n=1 Tax=Pleomassaria siparia CBS 279.74 TaxID=1314801 RepID=A0A6G1JZK6_9PLEO|nr:hypothetical protein K504DRAFT_505758 [Pleomassaria siparia CBS 279.74]